MKRTVAQSRMHHPWAQRGSKSHKDERRRDTEREPIVCPVPWNLHLETAGKLRVLLLWRSLWGGVGAKLKGGPFAVMELFCILIMVGENCMELCTHTHTGVYN